MLLRFSVGDTGLNTDAGRVTVDARSVTCNDCVSPRGQSLFVSRLPPREEMVCGMEVVEADLNMLWRKSLFVTV